MNPETFREIQGMVCTECGNRLGETIGCTRCDGERRKQARIAETRSQREQDDANALGRMTLRQIQATEGGPKKSRAATPERDKFGAAIKLSKRKNIHISDAFKEIENRKED